MQSFYCFLCNRTIDIILNFISILQIRKLWIFKVLTLIQSDSGIHLFFIENIEHCRLFCFHFSVCLQLFPYFKFQTFLNIVCFQSASLLLVCFQSLFSKSFFCSMEWFRMKTDYCLIDTYFSTVAGREIQIIA